MLIPKAVLGGFCEGMALAHTGGAMFFLFIEARPDMAVCVAFTGVLWLRLSSR